MAASTTISGARPQHRAARISEASFQGCLALDWANGQAITASGSSQQSTAFDTANDRIVMVSVGGASTVVGVFISVGTNPTASSGAGSLWIAQNEGPTPIYVPAGMLIAVLQGASAGNVQMIPALLAGL